MKIIRLSLLAAFFYGVYFALSSEGRAFFAQFFIDDKNEIMARNARLLQEQSKISNESYQSKLKKEKQAEIDKNILMANEFVAAKLKATKLKTDDLNSEEIELRKLNEEYAVYGENLNKDITCLEKNNFDCTLKSEKILLQLGFASEKGDKTYSKHAYEELKKIRDTKEGEMNQLTASIAKLKEEIKKETIDNDLLSEKLTVYLADPKNLVALKEVLKFDAPKEESKIESNAAPIAEAKEEKTNQTPLPTDNSNSPDRAPASTPEPIVEELK